ncbi:tapasin-like isoform X2 [Aquarana catesbeiana]|uniref:tapasin-like isoform X2 n=1 Tax=Aquarana catesbeiana TaxID=8400 RepID=UPI003CC987CF
MSPLGFLWLIFLQHTGAALGYVLFTHSARRGSNTTIPCKFDVNAVPPAQRTFSVIWHFQEKEIFRYPNNPEVLNSRLSIDQDRIKDGTADLYMSGVSISDGGLYKCSMTQIPGEKEKEIRLDVYAPPRITITGENIFISKENVLSCAISGFYPVDIDIKWLRDGIILNNITLEKPQRDPDGTYSVRSSVTIIPTEEDRKRIFSCRIQHESLTTPLQEDFQLVYGGKKNHNKVKNGENQEKKLMASNLQDQNKHHEDNQENQKENLLANNPLGNITYICTFTFSLCTFAI